MQTMCPSSLHSLPGGIKVVCVFQKFILGPSPEVLELSS